MIASRRLAVLRPAADPFWAYFLRYAAQETPPSAADLRFGNPTEMAPKEYVDTLLRWTEPRSPDWFAYPVSLPAARQHVAALCRDELGVPVHAEDVHLTGGTFGGLALVFQALVDPGDEVVVLDPPWFFYDLMVAAAGGHTVHVPLSPPTFSPDPGRIAAALTSRTRAVVLNSPHNPTGRIYSEVELAAVAEVLREAAQRFGAPIRLLSDDSYRRVVFDGRTAPSPARAYPDTVLLHTYGKTTLAPGERIGWVAVPEGFADRAAFREAFPLLQVAHGWAWPDAVLQRALPDLETVRIDLVAMQARRDLLVGALLDAGYQTLRPEGTFYVFARCPEPDDVAFCERLAAEHGVYLLPGMVFRTPGWFRVSLTASLPMVEAAVTALQAIRLPLQEGAQAQ